MYVSCFSSLFTGASASLLRDFRALVQQHARDVLAGKRTMREVEEDILAGTLLQSKEGREPEAAAALVPPSSLSSATAGPMSNLQISTMHKEINRPHGTYE